MCADEGRMLQNDGKPLPFGPVCGAWPMTAVQSANPGAACEEDDLDEPSRRRVRSVELSNVGPSRWRATLSRHARCLQRIAKDVAAETRLTFDEVVRTLQAGRLGADDLRAMLAQGAESPGLVAWRTLALNELRRG
jgi:hypothetical protein